MSLVRACSADRAQAVARGALRTIDNQGFAPSAGLEVDTVSDEVALLQWDLAYLGFMNVDDVSSGGGRFGPLTEAAVSAFQESNGVTPTGSYGDLTAAALVSAGPAAAEADTRASADDGPGVPADDAGRPVAALPDGRGPNWIILLSLRHRGEALRALRAHGSSLMEVSMLLATLLSALETRGGRKGVASLCIGGGEATAMAVELV